MHKHNLKAPCSSVVCQCKGPRLGRAVVKSLMKHVLLVLSRQYGNKLYGDYIPVRYSLLKASKMLGGFEALGHG